jgi:hypothetical protein
VSSTSWQWVKANPDAAARRIRELQRENAALLQEIDSLKSAVEALALSTMQKEEYP